MGIPERLAEPPRCDCSRKELRRRRLASGAVIVGYQCLGCGRSVERIAKRDLDASRLPWWDEPLAQRWKARVDAYWRERSRAFEQQREDEARRFWERYHRHMASEEWADLRRRVFARCKGLCEGCGERRAVQVHHLTYARLGDEMLFDLVAMCMTCHEKIHDRPIGG
jgi:5-methylcytosine-specific restriction endonuclease McrA